MTTDMAGITDTHDGIRAPSSIRELVFGIADGLVSTGGAVIGIAAGTNNGKIVVFSGIVIVIVEALSMAAGSYLSSKSHNQYVARRIDDKMKRIKEDPDGEREALRAIYRRKGLTEEEATMLVGRVTADETFWLEEMVAHELHIDSSETMKSGRAAAVMWVAYTCGGAVPVLPFVFLDVQPAMGATFGLGLVALFALGYWKAKATGINAMRSAMEMVVVAGAAGAFGYIAGSVIGPLFGVDIRG